MLQYQPEVADEIDPTADDFQLGGVADVAEWYTDGLQRLIDRAPEQYWWLHRRWKGEPSARALKQLQRRAKAA